MSRVRPQNLKYPCCRHHPVDGFPHHLRRKVDPTEGSSSIDTCHRLARGLEFRRRLERVRLPVAMGNSVPVNPNHSLLSPFQKKKLLHEYHTFYDLNKDGIIEWHDFSMARENICLLNGWVPGSKKYEETSALFKDIWTSLCRCGDRNQDDAITADEWITMWEKFHKAACRKETQELPSWLSNYLQFRFNMYDRTGDGVIDCEEFVYVVTRLGVLEKDARQAYLIFTETNTKEVDFDYFSKLVAEYYLSDDPCSLGNFITGKLEF